MRTKNVCMSIVMLLVSISLSAQSFIGKVVDEQSTPISYATVGLLSDADSTSIQGCITGNDGTFSLKVPENKPYILQISFMGYKTYCEKITPQNLGVITLQTNDIELGEIMVNGHIPTYKMISGGISTNISNSVLSKAGTANNVIEHIPGIRKKQDGTFEVLGKGSPLIYINNRKIRDLSELNRLNSDDIQQIELITSPGAKYDASVGAVLRIQTHKKENEGLSLDVRSSLDYAYKINTNEQINLDYQHKGLELFGSFQHNLKHTKETAVTNQFTYVDTQWEQSTKSTDHGKYQSYFSQLGFSYTINPNHSLGAMYELTATPNFTMRNYNITDVYADHLFYDKWNTFDYSKEKFYPTHHTNIYYVGTWGKLNIDFNTDILTGKNNENENVIEKSMNYEDFTVSTVSDTKNRLYAGKLVLSYPLWKGVIAAGSEYSHTQRYSNFSGYGEIIHSTDDKIKDRNLSFFMDYNCNIGKVNASAGLRYEHVIYDFYENGIYQSDESKTYNNLFPTLSLDANLGKTRLSLNYNIQTIRPVYEMLKNATHYGNRFTYLSGTPNLQPTYIQSVGLRGSYKDLQLMVGYNHYKDDIFFSVEQYEPDPKISINKFSNIKNRDEMIASVTFAPTIGIWKPGWTISSCTQWLGVQYLNEHKNMDGTVFHFQWDNSFSLPAGFIFRIDAALDSNGKSQNKKLKSTGFVNTSLSKELCNDKLSFLLEGNDLFHTMRDASYQFDMRSMQYRATKDNTRQVKLTIRYKFNGNNSQYKGTGAGINEMNRL